MADARDFPHIDAFIGEEGRQADLIEATLDPLPEQQLAAIDDGLQYLDPDQDRYREWRSQLADGRATTMHSELLMLRVFRRKLPADAVTLSKELPESGTDFDTVVEWNDTEFWIEVVKPAFATRLSDDEVGAMGWDWIPDAVERKLESDFVPATEQLGDDAVLVLAIYAEEIVHTGTSISRWLDRSDFDPGEYCDAFLEYTHLAGDTRLSVRDFTDDAEEVHDLIDEVVDEVEE